jgi:hypothetical protein
VGSSAYSWYRNVLSELPYDNENSTRNFDYCATSLMLKK